MYLFDFIPYLKAHLNFYFAMFCLNWVARVLALCISYAPKDQSLLKHRGQEGLLGGWVEEDEEHLAFPELFQALCRLAGCFFEGHLEDIVRLWLLCAVCCPGGQRSGGLPPAWSQHLLCVAGINPQLTEILSVLNNRHLKMGVYSSIVFFSIEGWDLGGRGKQILFSWL